jgi:vacuolar protein sorting-associated protein 41
MDVPGTTLANGDQDEHLRKRDPSARSSPRYHTSDPRESTNSGDEQHEDVCQEDHEEEDEDGEDEDEEPRLKYIRLTRQLPTIYRGGDATSTFVAAGDKLVCYLLP